MKHMVVFNSYKYSILFRGNYFSTLLSHLLPRRTNMQFTPILSFENATGKIPYNMTNDYMFRYILQKNRKVLKGLISSLLHLDPNNILDLEITNPIDLANDITGKEFVLDINIMMNNNTKINLEMQVANKHNWPDRSLSYMCRSFDQLYRGHEYDEALPVIHIGFLDFTLFPEHPEFYSTHMLMNVKNHHVFSGKLKLSVVDLSKIELATDDDRAHGIDYWARLFKAKTWEEIKMLVEKDEYMREAAGSIYMANADEMIRQRCLAREEYERHERTIKRDMKRLQEEKEALQSENDALQSENDALQNEIDALKEELERLKTK